MLKKWIKKVLVVIVLLSVFVGQTNITSFAQIGSKDNAKERQINNAWDGITRENSYEGNYDNDSSCNRGRCRGDSCNLRKIY